MQSPLVDAHAAGRAPRYGAAAVAFHWLAAVLIVFLATLGLNFDRFPRETQAFWINIHGAVGLIYFALVIARLIWRATHRPPDLPPDVGEFSRRASYPAHLIMYGFMAAIPIVGFVAFVWHGRAFDYGLFRLDFGVPSNRAIFHPAEDIHLWLVYGLLGLATLHTLAALWHHFVRGDGVLRRMIPHI